MLQIFDAEGQSSDQIRAAKAVYIPGEEKDFTAYFAGSVNIETRDSLKVLTENLTFTNADQTAKAEEAVTFERANIRGSSIGAIVNANLKRVELLQNVNIETFAGENGSTKFNGPSTMTAGYAVYDQGQEAIELRGAVHLTTRTVSGSGTDSADVRAGRAQVFLSGNRETDLDVDRAELFESVQITTIQNKGKPTIMSAGYAKYARLADTFEMNGNVVINTVEGDRPTVAKANYASYEQKARKIILKGAAEIVQGTDLIKGETMSADLHPSKTIKYAVSRGGGYLRQITPERTTEISGEELNASFGNSENLTHANAIRTAEALLTPANPVEYSKVRMTAPNAIRVVFKGAGLLDNMTSEGRTTINLNVPDNAADAANKRLVADTVKTSFDESGRNLTRAEAIGNGELYIEPLKASVENYKTAVTAPKFECDFFPNGNNAKSCNAGNKVNTVRTPTVQTPGRGKQTMNSERVTAAFDQGTKDLQSLDAVVNAKFTELDRSATAERFNFTSADQIVRLRGEPVAWDSKARGKADEIDWDTRNQRSQLRGSVSTTYYSQKQTGGAAPFGQTDRPVYLTSVKTDLDHAAESALYTGNARAWQDNNYVRANSILIKQREGQLIAEGSVQSSLSDLNRTTGGRQSKVPVYATSNTMTYSRDTRILRYETNVDIRQGTDRLTGAVANIYMDERNELTRTDVEKNVSIEQPGRTASGNFARYTAADEVVVLRGDPARVNDSKSGSSQGSELTLRLRDNSVSGQGVSGKDPSGRVRSVFKIKNN
jgi:lipopolysaccharide export system protein LptA